MPFGQDLDFKRYEIRKEINARAGELRKVFVTDVPHQDHVYTRKREQAEEFARTGKGGVYLEAEVKAGRCKDQSEAVSRILAAADRTDKVMAEIETVRLAAVSVIDTAKDVRVMQDVLRHLDNELDRIQRKFAPG